MESLGLLYQRYLELVYGVCLKYLQDTAAAEDATMDIFTELVRKLPNQQIRSWRPWLYVFTKNHCLMALRKQKSAGRFKADPEEIMQSEPILHPFTEENDQKEKTFRNLEICLETLVAEQKRCIRLFYLEEKSYKEIARQTDWPLGSVRSYIQNGRRNL